MCSDFVVFLLVYRSSGLCDVHCTQFMKTINKTVTASKRNKIQNDQTVCQDVTLILQYDILLQTNCKELN